MPAFQTDPNCGVSAASLSPTVSASSQMFSDEELQLHDDEGAPVNRKQYRSNEAAKKLEAIDWAKKVSIKSAALKFNVDRKSIRKWMEDEGALKRQISTPYGGKRKRLDGGGRHTLHPEIDEELAEWVRQMRENKRMVSRRIIRNKAIEMFRGTEVKVGLAELMSHDT
jgi:hypothetical protein